MGFGRPKGKTGEERGNVQVIPGRWENGVCVLVCALCPHGGDPMAVSVSNRRHPGDPVAGTWGSGDQSGKPGKGERDVQVISGRRENGVCV